MEKKISELIQTVRNWPQLLTSQDLNSRLLYTFAFSKERSWNCRYCYWPCRNLSQQLTKFPSTLESTTLILVCLTGKIPKSSKRVVRKNADHKSEIVLCYCHVLLITTKIAQNHLGEILYTKDNIPEWFKKPQFPTICFSSSRTMKALRLVQAQFQCENSVYWISICEFNTNAEVVCEFSFTHRQVHFFTSYSSFFFAVNKTKQQKTQETQSAI